MEDIKAFKPLLASPADLDTLQFPLWASAKYDGVRALVRGGVVYARSMKPIKNQLIQDIIGANPELQWMDGEIIWGSPTAKDVFKRSQQFTSTSNLVPRPGQWMFYVFDHTENLAMGYGHRYAEAKDRIKAARTMSKVMEVNLVGQVVIHDMAQLLEVEKEALAAGYEGLMLRSPSASYKLGRSTAKEGILLKLKRFEHCEAEVFGAFEQMHNGNEATVGELGQTRRSSHKENKTGKGTLGGFHVRCINGEFKTIAVDVGTGWTDEERRDLWADYHELGAKKFNKKHGYLRLKYQSVGSLDRPRFPVFDGWRQREDV